MIENIEKVIKDSENKLKPLFEELEDVALFNQEKVIKAFQKNRVALRHFSGTTGYGYDDVGRDTLNQIFADVFGAESGIVSTLITCGSHALKIALYGLLRPNDTMISITGKPYDTLDDTIFGKKDADIGSLKDFGVKYNQINLKNGKLDYPEIIKASKTNPKILYLQRSKGYEDRDALSVLVIKDIIKEIRKVNTMSIIFVDNCYGEFVEKQEPTDVGANVMVGSLIKNPGGGIAPSGGYMVGDKKYIDLIASAYTSPSLGLEVGSNEFGYRLLYQGLFMAPHIVLQALKGSALIGTALQGLGYKVTPKADEKMYDIIRSIRFNKKEELIDFCKEIQFNSPVDSYVTPEPWDMPGYNEQVIMAAGTFVQGASIELSCDAPIKEPYILYLQGGLTYEHVKIALKNCLKNL